MNFICKVVIVVQEIVACDVNGDSITGLVQWDKDVYVYLRDSGIDNAYRVHFFNNTMDEALVVDSTYSGGILKVKIPNTLLTQPYIITGYVNVTKNDEAKCLYGFKINIRKKPKPSDIVHVNSDDYISIEKIREECKQFANNAEQSANKSASSAAQAKASETAAKASETNASNSASAAKASETNASNFASAAKASENAAKASEEAAKKSETNSARSEANAKTSETASANSAAASKTSETNAKASEQKASQSETNAKASEQKASQSESNAKESELAAAKSENAAKDSETKAKESETNASNSASSAKESELNAAESESNANVYMNMTKTIADSIQNMSRWTNAIIDDITLISYFIGIEDGVVYISDEFE